MHLRPGTAVEERYVVEGRIGAGGMALVYRLRHATLDSRHALKLLTHGSPGVRRRLLAEGRAQGQLRHPHVVAVTDVVTVGGAPGLVMEYVAGPSLDRLLAVRRLAVEELDLIARGILEGMAAAHAAGLVHRDLKPANVLLAPGPGRVIPKVADFGLVKGGHAPQASALTRTGAVMGTPAYMAPEQIRDAASVDRRADVWALGAVLYELASGRRAFTGADTFALYEQIAYGRYTPLRALHPELPDRMLSAVEAALRVSPQARPADASELLAAWVGQPPASAPEWPAALVREVAALAPSLDTQAPHGASEHTLDLDALATPQPVDTPPVAPPAQAEVAHTLARPRPDLLVTAGGAGLGAGLLAAAGLAPSLLGNDLAATYPGWPVIPAWTPPLGMLLAGLAPLLLIALAARRVEQGALFGAGTGLLAGLLANALCTAPAAALRGLAGFLAIVGRGEVLEGPALARAVASGLTELTWTVGAAYLATTLAAVFLGAVSGVLARVGTDTPPAPLRPSEVLRLGQIGVSVLVVSAVALVLVLAAGGAIDERLREVEGLPSFVANLMSRLPLVSVVPWLALGGGLYAWSASRPLAVRAPGFHRGTSAGLLLLWPFLALVIAAVVRLAPGTGADPVFALAMAGVGLTWGVATAAAVAWARRNPLSEPVLPTAGEVAGKALVEVLLMTTVAWGSAGTTLAAAGLVLVANIEVITEGAVAPAPIELATLLLQAHLAPLAFAALVFATGQLLAQPYAWWQRRRWQRGLAAGG